VTSGFRSSSGGWNRFVGRLIGGILGAPESGSDGGLGLEDIGRLIGWFSGGPGGTLGAPGDDGP